MKLSDLLLAVETKAKLYGDLEVVIAHAGKFKPLEPHDIEYANDPVLQGHGPARYKALVIETIDL